MNSLIVNVNNTRRNLIEKGTACNDPQPYAKLKGVSENWLHSMKRKRKKHWGKNTANLHRKVWLSLSLSVWVI